MQIAKLRAPLGIILIGLTPIFMVLLPWDFGNEVTPYRWFMRWKSLPVVIVEMLFVLWSMTRGFSPLTQITALDRETKAGILVLTGVAAWTTTFVANEPSMGLIAIFRFFAHFMFALAMAYQLTTWTIEQRNLIWPAVGLGVIGFCLLWGANIYFYRPTGIDWAIFVPTLTIIRSAGYYALALFCAGIALFLSNLDSRGGRLSRALGILFGIIGINLAFWTGTRAAAVAILTLVALSSLIFSNRSVLVKYYLITIVIGIAIAAALPVVHPYYGVERVIGASIQSTSIDEVSSGRLQIWKDMTVKILDRPLMGWGIDQFGYSFPPGTPSISQPHQGVMQLIFSSGLIGVTAALFILISFIRKIPRKIEFPYQYASAAFVFAAFVYASIDGFFYFAYPTMIFVIGGAVLIAAEPKQNGDNAANMTSN